MDVMARPAREVGFGDFADITNATVTAIDWAAPGVLRVSFDSDLTTAQQLRVRLRITSCDSDQEQLRVAAATFLPLDAPTLAQVVAQVKRLTRIVLLEDS